MTPRMTMWKIAMAAALVAEATPSWAQTAPPTAATEEAVDPLALQALRQMGIELKTLKSFELRAKATIETNLEDTDLKVTLGLENLYRVQRPDRLFAELRSDRQLRQYYYDGKSFTVNVPRQGFYANVAAPPTLDGLINRIYADYGITLPLSDLIQWSETGAPTDGIRSAVRVGYAKIGNVDTDQFAFRGDDLDFQLWIARGPHPLPAKIAFTSRDDPSRSSYSAELTWNTEAKFAPTVFAFKPDPKSSAILLARIPDEEQ